MSAAASLVLLAGTAGLWARSYFVADMMRRQDVWYTSGTGCRDATRPEGRFGRGPRGVTVQHPARGCRLVEGPSYSDADAADDPVRRFDPSRHERWSGPNATDDVGGQRRQRQQPGLRPAPRGGRRRRPAQHESVVWWAHQSPPRVLLKDAPTTLTFWRRLGFHYHYQHNEPAASAKVDQWQLGLPYWLAAVAFAVLPVRWLGVGAHQWRRRRKGWCVPCGYDLSGNVSGVCPECGTPAGAATLSRPVERPFPAP